MECTTSSLAQQLVREALLPFSFSLTAFRQKLFLSKTIRL